jgi:hypothetical protein
MITVSFMQAPNHKRQITNKFQFSKFKIPSSSPSPLRGEGMGEGRFGHFGLVFGAYLACLREAASAKAGIWNLGFGILEMILFANISPASLR